MERIPYDEFSMFHENAEEFGLPYDGPPDRAARVGGGRAGPSAERAGVGRRRARARVPARRRAERAHLGHGGDGARPPARRPRPPRPRPLRRRPQRLIDVASQRRGRRRRDPGAGARRAGRRRHVARRHDHDRTRRPRTRAGAQGGAGRRDPRRERVEVVDHRRVHQRPRELRQLRRPARPHHRVQPDPHRVVAAARHPAQRRAARGRQLGVALPAVPRVRAHGSHRARAESAPVTRTSGTSGTRSRASRCRCCSRAACASSRWSTTTTRSSCCVGCPNAQVEHFEEAGHSLQGDTPVELAQSIERFVFSWQASSASAGGRGSRRSRR